MRTIVNNSKLQIGLLLSVSCVLIYGLLTDIHNWGGDFSGYIMQAKSIVEQDISGYIASSNSVIYPWGFPILLAPFYKVFGLDILWLKMVGVICYVLFLLVIYHGFTKYHSRAGILGVTAVFALNPHMLTFLNQILSDIPFLLFSTLCVFLVGRVIVQRRPIISFPIDYMLIGIILGIAFLIRNNGALLIILVALTQLVSAASGNHNRELDFSLAKRLVRIGDALKTTPVSLVIGLIPYTTFFCLLGLVALWHPQLLFGGALHLGVLDRALDNTLPNLIVLNAAYYAAIPVKFFGSFLLYAMSVPFVLIGITRRYKSDYHILLYVALVVFFHLIWPGRQGLRYLFPLLPFYVSFMVTGIEVSHRSAAIFGKRIKPSYLVVAVMMTLLFFTEEIGYRIYENVTNGRTVLWGPFRPDRTWLWGPFSPQAREMFHFIRDNTDTEDIIVFFKPRVMRLMTDRMSIAHRRGKDINMGDYLVVLKNPEAIYYRGNLYGDVLKSIPHRKTLFDNARFTVIKL
ncbi:ArnT family glycosyltransferase [Candidatus Thiosymbion oneisti]|uniref:ArnT family glycosyltransferase n=1 Tax=Candidatus Thiosymbion oneisti TaxID=589554 RepID=UPI00105E3EB4|nr:glycosyltransferase family 39 protein [Candidatus Thiosymbion oneisti]